MGKRSPGASSRTVMIVAGTRPECIKLAPVVHAFAQRDDVDACVVNSGQHVDAVRRMFDGFGISCDVVLPAQQGAPNLATASRRMERLLGELIARIQPAMVMVQGDTLTAFAGARAAHAAGIAVIHVEAGLRAPTVTDPFPEEWFRRRIARHADLHFAPCASAQQNLLDEGVAPESIHHVGNTGIDSLRTLFDQQGLSPRQSRAQSPLVLVTLHRRENWDGNAEVVCDALLTLATKHPALRFVLPVHPNPRIATRLRRRLGVHPRFDLVAPMEYPMFVAMAASAMLLISDSGGIQEEAPHLGVPLLVPRTCTERPEGIATGFVRLVNIDRDAIVAAATEMLVAPRRAAVAFDQHAPFGAGDAANRIVDVLATMLVEAVAA
ncbi:MAG: UDP-N-acetylglucosamine 2-epimerase (non-hydrolyzing) [Betaproteobacteria bacterium]